MPTRSARSNLKEKKRKTRKRAVLQFRIPQADYQELAKAAVQRDLTISEEAARRLREYRFAVEREKLTAELDEALGEVGLREQRLRHAVRELESLGYKKANGRDLWLGPNEPSPLVASSAELEELLTKAAKLGAELAIKESNR